MKIVTLLPAATEIVCALGLCDMLVGRSHECDFPEDIADLPSLTRARIDRNLPSQELDDQVRRMVAARLPLYMLDEQKLAALAPDVVITQSTCEVCAVSYDQVAASLKRTAPRARIVTLLPTRLAHILENVLEVAQACGVPERGKALVGSLGQRLAAVAAQAPATRPRTAVVEWLSPVMLAGHWVPDVIASAGGSYCGLEPGVPTRATSWDELRRLELDCLIVACCGFDLPRTLGEAPAYAAQLRQMAPRVLFMDGSAYVNRPGPRMVDAIEMIAAALRGEPALVGLDALEQPRSELDIAV